MRSVPAFACVVLIAASTALAVVPAADVFLPSVGRGQGSCPGGVCSEWRTDVWIFNPAAEEEAAVEISFLVRGADNGDPDTETVTVAAGETRELADVIQSLFGLDGVFGALRFVADLDIVVTGRIYDANVVTNLGTGTAGQFFAALPAWLAIASGESTELIGLAQDDAGVWRSNFGFVETTGSPVTVEAALCDADGAVLATRSYPELPGFGTDQVSIAGVGGPPGSNLRLQVRVVGGSGQVLAFASRIDNRTGDPSTVEMVTKAGVAHDSGLFQGVVLTPDGLRIDGGIELGLGADGLVEFSGVAGVPCGEDSFTVDFALPPTSPIALDANGGFTTSVAIPYNDGAVTVFTIDWTLTGTLASDGTMAGTLAGEVSGGVGGWAACDGTSERSWSAGWSGGYSR